MIKRDTIWVRNNSTRVLESRYDGEDFVLNPGEHMEMYADCAKLVLGLGEPSKSRAIRRLGWGGTVQEEAVAIKELMNFSFHMTEMEAQGHSPAPVGSQGDPDEAASSDAASPKSGGAPAAQKSPGTQRRARGALKNLAAVSAGAA